MFPSVPLHHYPHQPLAALEPPPATPAISLMMQPRRTPKQLHLMPQDLLLAETFLPQRKVSAMQPLHLPPALSTEILMPAQAIFGHVGTVLTHDPRAPLRFEQRPSRITIAFTVHAALDAEIPSLFDVYETGIAWHKIVIWPETTAIDAVAEVALDAAALVLQAPHLFVAEGPDERVKVPVHEP